MGDVKTVVSPHSSSDLDQKNEIWNFRTVKIGQSRSRMYCGLPQPHLLKDLVAFLIREKWYRDGKMRRPRWRCARCMMHKCTATSRLWQTDQRALSLLGEKGPNGGTLHRLAPEIQAFALTLVHHTIQIQFIIHLGLIHEFYWLKM